MRSLWLLSLLPLAACMTPPVRPAGTIFSPAETAQAEWTDQEKAASSVVRNLRSSAEASFHVLRVQGELPMRKHAKSDLVLVVVAGQVELHLGDKTLPSAPGDVVEVPRDAAYGVLNKGKQAAVLYLVFTPGFDPADVKTVVEASGVGAWQYNLWSQ